MTFGGSDSPHSPLTERFCISPMAVTAGGVVGHAMCTGLAVVGALMRVSRY